MVCNHSAGQQTVRAAANAPAALATRIVCWPRARRLHIGSPGVDTGQHSIVHAVCRSHRAAYFGRSASSRRSIGPRRARRWPNRGAFIPYVMLPVLYLVHDLPRYLTSSRALKLLRTVISYSGFTPLFITWRCQSGPYRAVISWQRRTIHGRLHPIRGRP